MTTDGTIGVMATIMAGEVIAHGYGTTGVITITTAHGDGTIGVMVTDTMVIIITVLGIILITMVMATVMDMDMDITATDITIVIMATTMGITVIEAMRIIEAEEAIIIPTPLPGIVRLDH